MRTATAARLLATVLALALLASAGAASARTDRYDAQIKKWASYYNPTIPWDLLKAQWVAESALNPRARSPVGAQGLTQVMPATWREIAGQLGLRGNPYDANLNLQFGHYYMSRMLRGWYAHGRSHDDRIRLAQASYNAGLGNLYKAQKRAGGCMDWPCIRAALPRVTGRHAKETHAYVDRIWRTWRTWQLGGQPSGR